MTFADVDAVATRLLRVTVGTSGGQRTWTPTRSYVATDDDPFAKNELEIFREGP